MLRLLSPGLLDRQQAYVDLMGHTDVQTTESRYAIFTVWLFGISRGLPHIWGHGIISEKPGRVCHIERYEKQIT